MGPQRRDDRLVEKHRWLNTAWLALTHREPAHPARALCASARRVPFGRGLRCPRQVRRGRTPGWTAANSADRQAREAHQAQAVRGAAGALGARRQPHFGRRQPHQRRAELGEFATLAIMLCPTPDKLLQACSSPNKKNGQLRSDSIKVAKAASDVAHAEWLESKNGADPARTREQRVGGCSMKRWLTTTQLGDALAAKFAQGGQAQFTLAEPSTRGGWSSAPSALESVRCSKREGRRLLVSVSALAYLLPSDVATVDRLDVEFGKLAQNQRAFATGKRSHSVLLSDSQAAAIRCTEAAKNRRAQISTETAAISAANRAEAGGARLAHLRRTFAAPRRSSLIAARA
jgi:hypothetical protein